MSPADLASLFENNPTQSYRLILDSGDRVIVADPRKTVVSAVTLVLRTSQDIAAPFGDLRFISIPNITMVEPITPAQIPGRSRRRRK